MNKLSGTRLAGADPLRGRAENDFYATPKSSVVDLLEREDFCFDNKIILEPCVGMGHIADVLSQYFSNSIVKGMDIVDRGWNGTKVSDFLTFDFADSKVGNIITNPPFNIAQEFIEKSLSILDNKGKCCMFLKIQFLEGKKRREFFKEFPQKTVYVFSERQSPMREGKETDENGKKWSSTMCFAWFVWEKGYKGETIIKWI